MVDKMYCINLWHRQDRWQLASDQFAANGMNVERFAAIDGREFIKPYPCDPGNNGCTLSHYFLIERAKIMGYKAIMIFEDDAELAPNFMSKMQVCLDHCPAEMQLLYMGGTHKIKPTPVNDHIMKVNKTLTTHAYIIRESLYDLVINNFKTLDQPVDSYFSQWQREFNFYVTNPPLAWQRAGHSDIQGKYQSYGHIKTNNQ